MQTADLQDRVEMTPPSTLGVIAAGPLTLQPHTVAYRVVLRALGSEFVVHNQFFPHATVHNGALIVGDECYYEAGSYFQAHELVAATERFAERVKQQARCIQSIYRDKIAA